MLIPKLSRALINKASRASNNPWTLIPSTEDHSAIITNGAIAMVATTFQVKQFELAWGKELYERDISSRAALQNINLAESREIHRTCILSDEQSIVGRMYMGSFGAGVFFADALLDMLGSPDILQVVNDIAVDDISHPAFWIMRRKSPKAEKVFAGSVMDSQDIANHSATIDAK